MRKLLLSALLLGVMSSVTYGKNEHDENKNDNKSDESRDQNKNTNDRNVPEIDPNSAVSAVFLLSSGVLMIRGRRKQ